MRFPDVQRTVPGRYVPRNTTCVAELGDRGKPRRSLTQYGGPKRPPDAGARFHLDSQGSSVEPVRGVQGGISSVR